MKKYLYPLILLAFLALLPLAVTSNYFLHLMILFLLWMPFGKFYHIIQRPAQLGIAIYRKAGDEGPQAVCPHNGEKFTSQMHLDDVKDVTAELGFNYVRMDGKTHLDYSPRGKRALLAQAHLKARQKAGSLFG